MTHIHERLGLTFQEYAALLAVRQLLVSGDIKLTYSNKPCDNGHYFNMAEPLIKGDEPNTECGSVGCIGGYMAFVMGMHYGDVMDFVNAHTKDEEGHQARLIRDLFFPPDDGQFSWNDLTPEMAVEAIDNFIKTGTPQWTSIAENHGIVFDPQDSDYDEE